MLKIWVITVSNLAPSVYRKRRYLIMMIWVVFLCQVMAVCHRVNTVCSGKGGLIIYVDTKYTTEIQIHMNIHESWEGLIVRIKCGGLAKTVTLGKIYRPSRSINYGLNAFIDEFSHIKSSLEKKNNN